jgi:DNA polymerase-1
VYFERYPGVREYMDRTRALAHEQGYVETLFGRRLYLPEINARNKMRQQAAERTAINAPMQGTAADIIKRAMLAVDDWLRDAQRRRTHDHAGARRTGAGGRRGSARQRVRRPCATRMGAAAELAVPLLVEAGNGANWDEAH